MNRYIAITLLVLSTPVLSAQYDCTFTWKQDLKDDSQEQLNRASVIIQSQDAFAYVRINQGAEHRFTVVEDKDFIYLSIRVYEKDNNEENSKFSHPEVILIEKETLLFLYGAIVGFPPMTEFPGEGNCVISSEE